MSAESSSPCPRCGKPLVVVGDEGRFLECSGLCGYRFDAFLSKEAAANDAEGSLFDEEEAKGTTKDLAWTTASELMNKYPLRNSP